MISLLAVTSSLLNCNGTLSQRVTNSHTWSHLITHLVTLNIESETYWHRDWHSPLAPSSKTLTPCSFWLVTVEVWESSWVCPRLEILNVIFVSSRTYGGLALSPSNSTGGQRPHWHPVTHSHFLLLKLSPLLTNTRIIQGKTWLALSY